MASRRWLFFRLIWPLLLASALPVLHLLWPRNDLVVLGPIFFPMLAAVLNLAASSRERPKMAPSGECPSFQRAVRSWHALEGLACILLMFFEAVTALGISAGVTGMIVVTFILFFVPYVMVTLWARRYLLRAYEELARIALEGRKLVKNVAQQE